MKLVLFFICLFPFLAKGLALDQVSPTQVVEFYRAGKISKNDILNYFANPKYPFVIKELFKANKGDKVYLLWHVEDRQGKKIFNHYATAFKVSGEGEDVRYTWRETSIAIDARDQFENRNNANDYKIALDLEVSNGRSELDGLEVKHQQLFVGASYQESLKNGYYLRAFLGAKKLLEIEYVNEISSQKKSSSFYPEVAFLFGRMWRKVNVGAGVKNTNVLSMSVENALLLKFVNVTALSAEVDYSLSPTFAARLGLDWMSSLLNEHTGFSYRVGVSYLPKWFPDFSLEGFFHSQILSTPQNQPDSQSYNFGLRTNYRW